MAEEDIGTPGRMEGDRFIPASSGAPTWKEKLIVVTVFFGVIGGIAFLLNLPHH